MSFEVQSAALVSDPPTSSLVRGKKAEGKTPSQWNGLRYQARVEGELERLFPGRLLLRPWFRYKRHDEVRRCQPDLILFSPQAEDVRWACVVEVKHSTIPEGWEQLLLYKKVVEKAYRIPIAVAMVTRVFDRVRFEGLRQVKATQLESMKGLEEWRGEGLGVVSWR
jgi:hypothetical protein